MTLPINIVNQRVVIGPSSSRVPVRGNTDTLRVTINGTRVPEFSRERGHYGVEDANVVSSFVFDQTHPLTLQTRVVPSVRLAPIATESASTRTLDALAVSFDQRHLDIVNVDAKILMRRLLTDAAAVVAVINISSGRPVKEITTTDVRSMSSTLKLLADKATVVDTKGAHTSVPLVGNVRINAPVWLGGRPLAGIASALAGVNASSSLVFDVPAKEFVAATAILANTMEIAMSREVIPLVATALTLLVRNRNGQAATAVSTNYSIGTDKRGDATATVHGGSTVGANVARHSISTAVDSSRAGIASFKQALAKADTWPILACNPKPLSSVAQTQTVNALMQDYVGGDYFAGDYVGRKYVLS